MDGLQSKVALVTGGAAGLGNAVAQRLAREGANVIITDVDVVLGEAAARDCGFVFLEQDVTSETQWTSLIADIEVRFGALDILVNNAGILGASEGADPEHSSLSDWRQIFAVNVEGVFLGCRAVIPAMRRSGAGAIINFSSIADSIATPHVAAYGASKAAVRQLTRSIALYCAQQGLNVRCNSVHPGMIRTPMVERSIAESAEKRGLSLAEVASEFTACIPLGDFMDAEDVAASVAFLASDDARQITGMAMFVDGGIVNCLSTVSARPSAE